MAKKKKQTPQVEEATPRKLSEKQRRFVEAYMGQAAGNATEAAGIAGYKGNRKTLEAVGRKNLANARIRAAIDERVAEDPAIATRKERQEFWTKTMQNNVIEMNHRLRASELLGKSQADFVEHIEHDVNISWMDVVNRSKTTLAERDSAAGITSDGDDEDDEL